MESTQGRLLAGLHGKKERRDQGPLLGETACHVRGHDVARRDVCSHEELQATRRRRVF